MKTSTFWQIVCILFSIIGFLASIYDWDWYFERGWRIPFLDAVFGRKIFRIINAAVCFIICAGGIFLLIRGLG